ncbi:hypothetical protein CKO12_10570 [Chromatium okenii]|uniref:Rha family transcriptional regulator n=1 Tax=Chromatium okenii TaxID=61644 RepID=UPI001907540D|nr:Rha family transcriptional regulator [Chromatium okenii]MBK1642315.1 hypothetical protein [Chromatium okenii]
MNPIVPSLSMTSREIADITDKRHDHVLRDIRTMISSLESVKSADSTLDWHCKSETYSDAQGKSRKQYRLNEFSYNLMLERYKGLQRVPNRLQEEAALKTIEQLLKIKLIRQYKVLSYRIDGYDPINNIAYEIDEPDHKHNRSKDNDRQKHIEKILGCSFVRIQL